MATFQENLIIRRDAVMERLAALEVDKPDYSIDGESVSWASNRASLMAELKQITEMIDQAEGPVVVETVAYV